MCQSAWFKSQLVGITATISMRPVRLVWSVQLRAESFACIQGATVLRLTLSRLSTSRLQTPLRGRDAIRWSSDNVVKVCKRIIILLNSRETLMCTDLQRR